MKRLLMAVAAVLVMAAPSYAQMGGFGMPGNVQIRYKIQRVYCFPNGYGASKGGAQNYGT